MNIDPCSGMNFWFVATVSMLMLMLIGAVVAWSRPRACLYLSAYLEGRGRALVARDDTQMRVERDARLRLELELASNLIGKVAGQSGHSFHYSKD